MFGTTAIPQTVPSRDWQALFQQPASAPLAQLLAEARQTNALLASILAALQNGSDPLTTRPNDLVLAERVEWLERQVAELKERPL
jgi:hypothetical protein